MNFITMESEKPDFAGKEKIYITGHKNNSALFCTIAEEILKIQNCTVYIDQDMITDNSNTATIPDRQLSLSQMQLIVFVITKDFFSDDCVARTFEFEYAKQNHIPILPVAVEGGLENAFNNICGNFHLLHRASAEYYEKLKHYIDFRFNQYNCIGAFPIQPEDCKSAKIFVSYRKKDRQAANKAITLLRSFDFLQDVEIWYDDFLTEGENYNEEIEENLLQSDIVLLIVTPNLLQQGNYVMDIEYPKAKSNNKHILPLMLADTDTKELAEKYKDIGEITGADDKEKVLEAIIQALKAIGKPAEQHLFPVEKLFMLACAYLDGKGMEYNPTIGISMLKKATDSGYHYALERLGKMHFMGIGVQKDYEKAKHYLYEAEKAFEADHDILSEENESIYHNARAIRLLALCDACLICDDFEGAMEALEKREASLEILYDKMEYFSYKNAPGTNFLKIAQIYQSLKNYRVALKYCQKAHNKIFRLEKAFNHPACIMNALQLSHCYGSIYHQLSVSDNNPEYIKQAVTFLLNALHRCRYFNNTYKQEQERTRAVAEELTGIANEYHSIGDNYNAIEIYTIIHDEYNEFCKEPSSELRDFSLLAITKINIGATTLKRDAGYQLMREAYEIFRELYRNNPENDEFYNGLAIASKYLEKWSKEKP